MESQLAECLVVMTAAMKGGQRRLGFHLASMMVQMTEKESVTVGCLDLMKLWAQKMAD